MPRLIFVLICSVAVSAQGGDEADWSKPLRQCWTLSAANPYETLLASDNDKEILILSPRNGLRSFNTADTSLIWQTELGAGVPIAFEIGTRYFYVVSRTENDRLTVRALSRSSGLTAWQADLPDETSVSLKVVDDGLYIFGRNGLSIVRVGRERTPESLSNRSFERLYSVKDGIALAGREDGTLAGVSLENGDEIFSTKLETPARSALLVSSNEIAFGDDNGGVSVIDARSGALKWRARTGGAIDSIAETERGLLITSLDNFLYVYDPSNGNLNWKRRLPGRPLEVSFVRDGILFAVVRNTPEGFVIDLRNGKTINRLTLADGADFTGPAIYSGGYLIAATTKGARGFGSSCGEK